MEGRETVFEGRGEPCPKCRGTGDVHGVRCHRCGGSGDLPANTQETVFRYIRRLAPGAFQSRRENRQHDATIRDWALYDAAAQDVGRSLYVAETMIHLAITNGADPHAAVSKHLDEVRDKFAIPYAKPRIALCNCGEEKAENCPADCEMRAAMEPGAAA